MKDKLKKFRCKKCGCSQTYVRKKDNIKRCARCGFEERVKK